MDFTAPEYFVRKSMRHVRRLLGELNDNEDKTVIAAADAARAQAKPVMAHWIAVQGRVKTLKP